MIDDANSDTNISLVRTSISLVNNTALLSVMPKRKRTELLAAANFAPRDDNRPYWWNDEVEYLSAHLRGKGSIDLTQSSAIIPTKKIGNKTTSNRKRAEVSFVRSRRIRLLPTMQQSQQFHKWFGIYRLVWNATAQRLNAGIKGSWMQHRNAIMTTTNNGLLCDNQQSPRVLRSAAVHDAVTAFEATRASLKAAHKDPDSAQIRLLTKKDRTQQFKIDANNDKSITFENDEIEFWPRRKLGSIAVKRLQDIDHLLPHYPWGVVSRQATIHYTKPNTYHVIVPIERILPEPRPVSVAMATDPGVRTFHTTYDSQKNCTEYNMKCSQSIMRRTQRARHLQLLITTHEQHKLQSWFDAREGKAVENAKFWRNRLQRHKKELGLLRMRISNIKRDAHWKLARLWCSKYSDMIVPKFNVMQMINKSTRNISTNIVEEMLYLSHCTFRHRLKSKAEELGARVHELGEHFTTKTCGKCGNIREMGRLTNYTCVINNCGYSAGRDHNAAFNIFIKNIHQAVRFKSNVD